jgi:hypothetical protein
MSESVVNFAAIAHHRAEHGDEFAAWAWQMWHAIDEICGGNLCLVCGAAFGADHAIECPGWFLDARRNA